MFLFYFIVKQGIRRPPGRGGGICYIIVEVFEERQLFRLDCRFYVMFALWGLKYRKKRETSLELFDSNKIGVLLSNLGFAMSFVDGHKGLKVIIILLL